MVKVKLTKRDYYKIIGYPDKIINEPDLNLLVNTDLKKL